MWIGEARSALAMLVLFSGLAANVALPFAAGWLLLFVIGFA